jgi:putative FmdB family regulatory protein
MPLYEYRCRACGHTLDVIQKYSDKPLKTCPECGKRTLEKCVSSPALQFKGSGFYITDYAKKGGKPAETGAKASGKKGDKKAAKPAAKKTPKDG